MSTWKFKISQLLLNWPFLIFELNDPSVQLLFFLITISFPDIRVFAQSKWACGKHLNPNSVLMSGYYREKRKEEIASLGNPIGIIYET
jgi:hypothetical protein